LRVFLIGLGGAGCRIAHEFFKSGKNNISGVLIDTDLADLGFLKHKYRISAAEGVLGGESAMKDLEIGVEALQADRYHIIEKITDVKGEVDCFFLISALGGGTGGAAGVILEELKKSFIEPIYYVGLLPSTEDLPTVTVNAVKGLRESIRHCDAFFPVNMDTLKTTTRLKGNLSSLNRQIFRYFNRIFQIGEVKGKGDVGENAVDFQDFVQSLKGLSVVGLKVRNFKEDPNMDKPEAVLALTQQAVKKTTLSVDPAHVNRALVVVLGDKGEMDFLGSIPARLWTERYIHGKAVRGGDIPLSKSGDVEVLVIFSEVKKSEEIAALYQKVSVLGKSTALVGNISEIMENIVSIKGKISELEGDVDATYNKLKKSIEKPE